MECEVIHHVDLNGFHDFIIATTTSFPCHVRVFFLPSNCKLFTRADEKEWPIARPTLNHVYSVVNLKCILRTKSLESKRSFAIEHFFYIGYKLHTLCPHALKGEAFNLFPNNSVKLEQHLRKSSEMVTPSYKSSTRKVTCWWVWPHFSTFAFMCSHQSKGIFLAATKDKGFRAMNFLL